MLGQVSFGGFVTFDAKECLSFRRYKVEVFYLTELNTHNKPDDKLYL